MGIYQGEVDLRDRAKTAVLSHRGFYVFNVMPFSLQRFHHFSTPNGAGAKIFDRCKRNHLYRRRPQLRRDHKTANKISLHRSQASREFKCKAF